MLVAGDTGNVFTSKGLLQHIEAEQITGPNLQDDGIKKDKYGAPVKFYVAPYGPNGYLNRQEAQQYSPEVFCFMANPDRPSSIRGVPPCQAAFPMLHRINDVCNAEAVAWQMLARYAVSITRPSGPEQAWNESKADDSKSSASLEGDAAERVTELDYAMIFNGEPGDEVKGIDHNIPGQNFSESLLMFLRLLGLPLGLPLEIILLDWTKSNYSQSRAVLEQAYQAFLDWQLMLQEEFLDKVLAWKVQEWIRARKIPNNEFSQNINKYAGWITPSFPWIDVLKETQAYGAKIDRSFTTHAQVCKSQNMEREKVVAQRKKEVLDAINIAKEIEEQTGTKVDYRTFCGMEPAKEAAPQNQDSEKENDEDR